MLIHLAEVDSTQAFLRRHPELGHCAVLADAQTHGQGRQGNRWESAAGAGLWLSASLPPASLPPGLVLQKAMAAVIQVLDVPGLGLKWPNDLVGQVNEPVPKPTCAALGAPGSSPQERRDEHSGSTRFEPDAVGDRPPPQPGGTSPGGRSAASAPLNDEPHRPAGPSLRSIPPGGVAAHVGFGTGSYGRMAKLGGIIGELTGGRLILGLGINLHHAPDLPDRPIPPAALADVAPRAWESRPLARAILEAWRDLSAPRPEVPRWPEAGTPLRWEGGQGVCLGWEPDGRLKVTTAAGIQRLSAGEVTGLGVPSNSVNPWESV